MCLDTFVSVSSCVCVIICEFLEQPSADGLWFVCEQLTLVRVVARFGLWLAPVTWGLPCLFAACLSKPCCVFAIKPLLTGLIRLFFFHLWIGGRCFNHTLTLHVEAVSCPCYWSFLDSNQKFHLRDLFLWSCSFAATFTCACVRVRVCSWLSPVCLRLLFCYSLRPGWLWSFLFLVSSTSLGFYRVPGAPFGLQATPSGSPTRRWGALSAALPWPRRRPEATRGPLLRHLHTPTPIVHLLLAEPSSLLGILFSSCCAQAREKRCIWALRRLWLPSLFIGWLVHWSVAQVVYCHPGRLVNWCFGLLAGRPSGTLLCWSVGTLVRLYFGMLVSWYVRCSFVPLHCKSVAWHKTTLKKFERRAAWFCFGFVVVFVLFFV